MALPPDMDRLIHEALSGLGETADAEALASAVRRLDHGLPAEDEFSVICAWLGKCELVHKLDQQQTPAASRDRFQVPDLLVKFEGTGPVLVEVKRCNDRTLTFKPGYRARLMAYAEMMNLPLLIAWKHHSVWTLFELRHARKARVNFNIAHQDAMKQNLLGLIAGDVGFVPMTGVGIHLTIAKEALLETKDDGDARIETWQMRITAVDFTDGSGQPAKLHPETVQLFATMDLEAEEDHSEQQLVQRFVMRNPNNIQFAHRALVALLEWESGSTGRPSWRSLLGAPRVVRSIDHFSAAIDRAMEEGVMRYALRQQPVDLPQFAHPALDVEAMRRGQA